MEYLLRLYDIYETSTYDSNDDMAADENTQLAYA